MKKILPVYLHIMVHVTIIIIRTRGIVDTCVIAAESADVETRTHPVVVCNAREQNGTYCTLSLYKV